MKMKFRILIQHHDEALPKVIKFLKDFDVIVYDVREADVVNKAGDKKGSGYILCCKASAYNFLKLREEYYTTELKYEGFRTLM